MDSMIKWKLKQKLTNLECFEIIQELYEGCKKELSYDKNENVDKNLFKIYQNFMPNEESEYTLTFSNSKKDIKPLISTLYVDESVSHVIHAQNFTIYIYE